MALHVLSLRGQAQLAIDGDPVGRTIGIDFSTSIDIDGLRQSEALTVEGAFAAITFDIRGVKVRIPAERILQLVEADMVAEIEEFVSDSA